ncbi:MAG: peptidoglycan-binding protein [Myxococcota bacterium]
MQSARATTFFLRPLTSGGATPVQPKPTLKTPVLYGADDMPLRRSVVASSRAIPETYSARALDLAFSLAKPAGAAVLIGAGLSPIAVAWADTIAVPESVATPADRAVAHSILFGDVAAATFDPHAQPVLRRGSKAPAVLLLQNRLNALGYDVGTPDGDFGRTTRAAVMEYQFDHHLLGRGRVDRATWIELAKAQSVRTPQATTTPGGVPILDRYPPGALVTERLFTEAAAIAHLPSSWAKSHALTALLVHESDGYTGRLNYTYHGRPQREVLAELRLGIISAHSSATGLGQLLLSNAEAYYPSGRAGIGNPLEEAVGMLRYIHAAYGTPEKAWADYGVGHEGY